MSFVPEGASKRRLVGLASVVAFVLAAGPVLAQGWPWDWGWGGSNREPPRPREPVYREAPPPQQPYQSSSRSICLQLEQRLAPLGLKVRWVEFPAGPQLLEGLAVGSIDFGATGDSQLGVGARINAIRLGDLAIRDAHVTFSDLHIFSRWKLDHTPALLIGMDILGLVDALVIDYRRSELQIRPRRGRS